MDDLYFRQLQVGPMANFVYLVGSLTTREAVAVDPAWDVRQILEAAQGDEMRVVGALITHTHFDHVGGEMRGHHIEGVQEFLEQAQAKIYVHKAEAARLRVPASDLVETDAYTRLELGQVSVEFIHTPGHTPGSQCFKV
ncbi:MAG TPA: MBL fold metallo-hydrolase, partial [bacterium]|nr:MBL fold metallo-hydrolase [bacterium]